MRLSVSLLIALILPSCVAHIKGGRNCGTIDATEKNIIEVAEAMTNWSGNSTRTKRRPTVNIQTYWNTITKGDDDEGSISNRKIAQSISILNAAFKPYFTFTLVDSNEENNANYWGIGQGQDRLMKNALRKGNCATLNIYSTNLANNLLGWATFPDGCANNIQYDGVVINSGTVPGGTISRYNEGDTLTHEVGHWLGLYHTFQGGCTGLGDEVDDTPAIAWGNSGCPEGRDSCGNGVNDQIENFMDYTDDACMDKFTLGQFTRMGSLWEIYRSDRTTGPTSPTSAPQKDPTDCTDNAATQFLMNEIEKEDGTIDVTARSCDWLKSQSSRRKKICNNKRDCNADFGSAQDSCPETCEFCGACDENKRGLFFLQKFNGAPVIKKCSWLAKQTKSKRTKFCKNTESGSCHGLASEVCPSTCYEISGCGNISA